MEWFKLYGNEYHSDPKILALSASERSCWISLLCFAGAANDSGRVRFLTEERLMMSANVSPMHDEWEQTIGILIKLEKLGMVTIDGDGTVTVKNWNKRQESYLTGAERQRRYRERQKSDTEVTDVSDKSSNDSNARTEENRKEYTSELPVREVRDSETERSPKPDRRVKDKEAIFFLFGKKQPWWHHKNQREAALRLFDRGVEKVKNGLSVMNENKEDRFCPQAHTPFEYEQKQPKLKAYMERKGL